MRPPLYALSLSLAIALAWSQPDEHRFQDDIDFPSGRALASDTFYPAASLFQPGFQAYINLQLYRFRIDGRMIKTENLSLARPIAIESDGQNRYLRFAAQVGGENAASDLWVNVAALRKELQPALRAQDPVASLTAALQGNRIAAPAPAKKNAQVSSDPVSEVAKKLEALKGKSIPIPTPRPDTGNRPASPSWGDARITEAFNKNRSLRKDWFQDIDKKRFDPDSDSAKKIIAGWSPPVDLGRVQGEYYYVVDHENPIPILTATGNDTGRRLEPGSFVVVELVRRYTFDGDAKKYRDSFLPSPLVKFRTTNLFFGENEVRGYMHIDGLREAFAPLEDIQKLKLSYEKYLPRLQGLYGQEDGNLTIERALRQFHSSICAIEGSSQQALWAKWEVFVKSKTNPRARQVALNAQHADLVTRTISGETQRQGMVLDPKNIQKRTRLQFHPDAERCQIDLIALAARNRALGGWHKSFQASYSGDFSGVVHPPKQFNVWFPHEMSRTKNRITSCPFSEDKSYQTEAQKKFPGYKDFQNFYSRVVLRMPVVLGMSDEGKPATSDPSYLKNLFLADPDEHMAPEERFQRLQQFVNYYHPGSMTPRGKVGTDVSAYRKGTLRNGFVRIVYLLESGEAWTYYPVTDGKLTRFDKLKNPHNLQIRITGKAKDLELEGEMKNMLAAHEFEIFDGKKWVNPAVIFRNPEISVPIQAHLLEFKLAGESPSAANERKVLLPSGVLPQCFEAEGYISKEAMDDGYASPYYWFDPKVKNEAADAFDRLMAGGKAGLGAFQGGAYFRSNAKSNGGLIPVKVTCMDPAYNKPSHNNGSVKGYPEFGGYCDPNIMMARKPR